MKSFIEFIKSNRVKSFIWRSVMMAVAFLCAIIADNIGLLELSPFWTTVGGLVLAEISKAINKNYQLKKLVGILP